MQLLKNNYYLFLFSIIPISIIIGPSVSLINILIIDISFLVTIILQKNFHFIKNKNFRYFLILYLYLIFNSFISLDFEVSQSRNFGFVRIIILFLAFNYFFLDNNFFKKIIFVWTIILSIVILDVFFESIYGKNILGFGGNSEYGSRIVSFFKNEPVVGGYLNAFLLIIISSCLVFVNEKYKNITLFFLFVFLLAIFITGERSNSIKAVLGSIVFLIFYKNLSYKFKFFSLAISLIIFSSIIFNSDFLKHRFINQINSMTDPNYNPYFKLYESGFEVFKNYPIFGVGNKNYRIETCNNIYQNQKYICQTHPHQIYLEFLSEHGIFGTFVIIYLIYKIIFSKFRSSIKKQNYIQIGTGIFLILTFMPLIPSGAFFTDTALTLFAINLSLFYACDKKLNLFNNKN